jgi:hypothetical protein
MEREPVVGDTLRQNGFPESEMINRDKHGAVVELAQRHAEEGHRQDAGRKRQVGSVHPGEAGVDAVQAACVGFEGLSSGPHVRVVPGAPCFLLIFQAFPCGGIFTSFRAAASRRAGGAVFSETNRSNTSGASCRTPGASPA